MSRRVAWAASKLKVTTTTLFLASLVSSITASCFSDYLAYSLVSSYTAACLRQSCTKLAWRTKEPTLLTSLLAINHKLLASPALYASTLYKSTHLSFACARRSLSDLWKSRGTSSWPAEDVESAPFYSDDY